jgi:methanogenic corrinoid protein MtbC1
MSAGGPSDSRYSSGKSGTPPNLANYASGPRYDLATIVQLVGLRPMILWGWEQQLGIPAPTRLNDEVGAVRRYSEQDLIACIWLRDQILNGISPIEAAARLRAAQRPAGDEDAWSGQQPEARAGEEPLGLGRVNTGPLSASSFSLPRAPKPTRPLSDLGAFSVDPSTSFTGQALQSSATATAGSNSPRGAETSQVWVSPLSGPLGQRIVSGPLGTPIVPSSLGGASASGLEIRPLMSSSAGPLGASQAYPAGSYASTAGVPGRARIGTGAGATPVRSRDPRTLLPQLIRALMNLDTEAANSVIRDTMDICTIETLGSNLLQPAVSRIAELWAHRDITGPEEHFATNYMRGLLCAIFRNTPENRAGPLAFVGCSPRELDDMPALLLAVFWRRAGLRVVYLGQDVDGDSLVEEARRRRPALVCLSASSSPRVRSLARICRHMAQLDKPRPAFTFVGPVFTRNPELQRKVAGVYLGDDAATATWHVTQLVGMDHR